MTRDEAKENLILSDDKIYGNCRNTAMEAIDKVYDDFENRTCSNCKFYKEYEYEIPGAEDFTHKVIGCSLMKLRVSNTFGCNKWEHKDLKKI